MSLGGPSGSSYDPPAKAEVCSDRHISRGSGDGCEITAMDSFFSNALHLVAPRFRRIADF